jgi:phosphohistidine swiveling domain-containing protein
LVTGVGIGTSIVSGTTRVLDSVDEAERFEDGDILVTEMTDPDWGPILERAGGVVTNRGGRTSHAAIVSRELGIPAVIGSETATEALRDDQTVTLSCAHSDAGQVYEGELDYESEEIDLDALPDPDTRVMLNLASPSAALDWWKLPVEGVGLARMEYVINNIIKVHPLALVAFDEVEDKTAQRRIEKLTEGYDDKAEYFVDHLSRGIATIAAAQHPHPVIVRLSDFKTNEYADLIGGRGFEPEEANPMLGWRGASRYYSDAYEKGFALECRALKRVRDEMGFTNVVAMVPFCRTPEEADRVLDVMADHGLKRGTNGLEVYVMAEIPANIALADKFAERFDGFSIGTNDLTQLTLGVGRDAERLTHLFDERNAAVKRRIAELIEEAHAAGRPVGICGQAPSDYPEFAEFLVEAGIDSISVTPDSVPNVLRGPRRVAGCPSRPRRLHEEHNQDRVEDDGQPAGDRREGKLRVHVVHQVRPRRQRREDRGVRDGRALVPVDAPPHDRPEAERDEERVLRDAPRQRQGHREDDRVGAPRRAGGEGDDETKDHQQAREHGGRDRLADAGHHVLGGAHGVGHLLQRHRQREDDGADGDPLAAVDEPVDCLLKLHSLEQRQAQPRQHRQHERLGDEEGGVLGIAEVEVGVQVRQDGDRQQRPDGPNEVDETGRVVVRHVHLRQLPRGEGRGLVPVELAGRAGPLGGVAHLFARDPRQHPAKSA